MKRFPDGRKKVYFIISAKIVDDESRQKWETKRERKREKTKWKKAFDRASKERERFLEASRRFLLCLLQWMQQSRRSSCLYELVSDWMIIFRGDRSVILPRNKLRVIVPCAFFLALWKLNNLVTKWRLQWVNANCAIESRLIEGAKLGRRGRYGTRMIKKVFLLRIKFFKPDVPSFSFPRERVNYAQWQIWN